MSLIHIVAQLQFIYFFCLRVNSQVVRRIEVSPVGRMENLSSLLRGSSSENELNIPCGNFSRQYACMCDYYGLPYREEVAWVGTLLLSQFESIIGAH